MKLVMGVARLYRGGTYGNAVPNRLPVLGWTSCDLSHDVREPRACLRERRQQVGLLSCFIRDVTALAEPAWSWAGTPARSRARSAPSSRRRCGTRRTHSAPFPLFALGCLYWDVELEGREFHVPRSRLARVASDHLPIVASLSVRRTARTPRPYVAGEALVPLE